MIDRNEDTYLAYMDRWQGEVTKEKTQEMEVEYAEASVPMTAEKPPS